MKNLALPEGALHVICVGAHPDDIEIGCGGTLLELLESRAETHLRWVVFTAKGKRREEAEAGARKFGAAAASCDLILHEFEDGFLPYHGEAVKRRFEELKKGPDPDLILTHWGGDFHQDHRLVSELCWNTFRDHLILEFEVPKYDGDFGRPNLYVALSRDRIDSKIAGLWQCFPSQREKDWFDEELFLSLARIRGMECRAPEGCAEAFFVRKATLAAS
jgi:LmbE family N-acetylglucosaminyl deacetylase